MEFPYDFNDPFPHDSNDIDIVEVEFLVKKITAKAVLVEYKNEEIWLPTSQISPTDGFDVGDTVNFEIPAWLADKNNID